ncbi:MAG: Sua5/YciO/YrdC/YwlC family protein [Saprospiraceae bacterium]
MFLLRDDISDIARLLRSGAIICYPTDTIWGIGCDATNQEAVERLSNLKGHPTGNGYILLVDSLDMLKRSVARIHPRVETMLAYLHRPISVVYQPDAALPKGVLAADGTVAIRIASDQFCQELIHELDRPIVSTAACLNGEPFPPTYGAISSEVLGAVDYVVKYRQDDREPQIPSTLARLDRHNELEFIRE